jgi:hypothetical protein
MGNGLHCTALHAALAVVAAGSRLLGPILIGISGRIFPAGCIGARVGYRSPESALPTRLAALCRKDVGPAAPLHILLARRPTVPSARGT